MNGVDFPVAKVLDGIAAAQEAGLAPVKVNMVVRRGMNEASILPMARWARAEGVTLRFIEYMDVGHTNGWRLDEVVPAEEIVAAIDAEMPLEAAARALPRRGRRPVALPRRDRRGEVGVIASVSQPFCGDCTRARLSAEGKLYTCLFSADGHDLRAVLRDADATDDRPARGDRPGLARPRRPLLRAANRGHGRPAADRDVRDGRLSAQLSTLPVHPPSTAADNSWIL